MTRPFPGAIGTAFRRRTQVAFTPQHGTAADVWTDRIGRAPELTAPGRGDVLVVVGAHPDDETLGAGGLIATAAHQGATVRVVVATDGDASHPDSPTHRPDQLAAIRRLEARTAVAELSPGTAPALLRLPDGALAGCTDQLAQLLEPHLREATHVVTTFAADGHPDHDAVAGVVAQWSAAHPGVSVWEFPIWAWHWSTVDGAALPWEHLGRLPLTPAAAAAKRAAVAAHVSQHAPLSSQRGDEAVLPPGVLAHFRRDSEPFVVRTPAAADGAYFDRLYADHASTGDPWGLADRFYERRKREVLLASLPRERFTRAFEPGCASGELTERLAGRCAELVSWDVAEAAVAHTRGRCPGVQVERGAIPAAWPDGAFDLVVLSEVGYYCTDLAALVERVRSSLASDGCVVACHWRHPAPEHPHTATDVHAALTDGLPALRRLVTHTEGDFLLDVWSADHRSVAERDGVLG